MADGDSSKRPQFGSRFLEDPGQVFEHNAWDNVQWDATQEEEARAKVEKNSQTPVSQEMQEKYEVEADHYWDEFYTQHQNRFFKDRHWLFTEFPELAPSDDQASVIPEQSEAQRTSAAVSEDGKSAERSNTTDAVISPGQSSEQAPSSHLTNTVSSSRQGDTDRSSNQSSVGQSSADPYLGESSKMRILEVGCGVGNTVFPVLQTNNDPGLFVYCCDLSSTAIQLVKDHPDYTSQRCHAFVCNIADPECDVPFPEESLDIVILIFVLSAIHPEKFQSTINRLVKFLKPGGRILLRDYGQYDLAQLRFKDGRCLSDNFYVRGNGTRVYFFTQEELREIFSKAGLCEEQNLVDRRLQVNRGRQLKMYRVWIQCKYRKPNHPDMT